MHPEKSLPEFPAQYSDSEPSNKDFFSLIFDDLDSDDKGIVVECMKNCLKCNDEETAKKGFHDVATCMIENCLDCSEHFKQKLDSVILSYNFNKSDINDDFNQFTKKKF